MNCPTARQYNTSSVLRDAHVMLRSVMIGGIWQWNRVITDARAVELQSRKNMDAHTLLAEYVVTTLKLLNCMGLTELLY